MVNKNIIFGVIVLLFFGVFVIAQVANSRTADIDLDKNVRDNLTAKGIISPQTSNLSCDGAICTYQLYQILPDGSKYGLGEHQVSREYCDTFEIVNESGEQTVCISYSYVDRATLDKRVDKNNLKWLDNYGGVVLPTREVESRETIESNTTYDIKERRR